MRIRLLLLVTFLSACTPTAQNTHGKAYDADSQYCRLLWRDATQMYQNQDASPNAQTDNPNRFPHETQYIGKSQRDEAMNAYNVDCESPSAYNARKETEKKIVFKKPITEL